jgi:hypothetical protein
MEKMRLIFVESISTPASKSLCPILQNQWPDEELVMVSIIANGLTKPAFPRGIPYSDYPLIRPANFKPNKTWLSNETFTIILRLAHGCEPVRENMTFDQAVLLLSEASSLIYLADLDYASVWGMDILQRHLNPSEASQALDVVRVPPALTEEAFKAAIENASKSDTDSEYQTLLNAGHVKRYFDYNFALNSFSVLGKLYREASGIQAPIYLGKVDLLIMGLAAREGRLPPGLGAHLKQWVGTGKYDGFESPFFEGLGSSIARQMAVIFLEDIGALALAGEGVDLHYALTEKGREFVSRLHKDCIDRDLPFRLAGWMERPFDEVKPVIDQYLLTFFRKQKRLQDA